VALIVVRSLREIDYRPPATPMAESARNPAPSAATVTIVPADERRPRAAVGAGAGVRAAVAGGDGAVRPEMLIEAGAPVGAVWLAARAGVAAPIERKFASGGAAARFRLRAFPLAAAIGLPRRLGPGWLVPGIAAGVDLLIASIDGPPESTTHVRAEPTAEAGLAFRLPVKSIVFVRAGVAVGWTLQPRNFDVGLTTPIFRTPDIYARGVLDFGLSFGKNRAPAGP
jgi:hypothetical protein